MAISDELYSVCLKCECPLLYLEKLEIGNATVSKDVQFRDYVLKCKKMSTCSKVKGYPIEQFEGMHFMTPQHHHL